MKKILTIAVRVAVCTAILATTLVVLFAFMYLWGQVMPHKLWCGLLGLALGAFAALSYEIGVITIARRFVPAMK